MSGLSGKVAVVTGASRGIGAAIARRLAREGARVAVNYRRRADAAEQVVAWIEEAGGEAFAVQADVSDLNQITALFDQTLDRFGRLDILVNNAGVSEWRLLADSDAAHYERQFSVNVRGVLFATQEAARRIGDSGGRILNITSGAAQATPPGMSVYSAGKAAVEALTKTFATELGPRGITVNAVSPGLIETNMLHQALTPEYRQAMIAQTPLGRLGEPEDIAGMVAFLASEEARWITGQVIGVNGGLKS
jgi:3-oxoacyl-[acyl-carrier protein] reductase